MSITTCRICGNGHSWSWEEAFDKFGFGDGDGMVMTHTVVNVLRRAGYIVTDGPWGCHNITITSIKTRKGRELIPDNIQLGYDDPRDYLPKRIVKFLDEAFPEGEEVLP